MEDVICFIKFAQSFSQILVIVWPDWVQIWPSTHLLLELYTILATLDNFEHWNQALLTKKCHHLSKDYTVFSGNGRILLWQNKYSSTH